MKTRKSVNVDGFTLNLAPTFTFFFGFMFQLAVTLVSSPLSILML